MKPFIYLKGLTFIGVGIGDLQVKVKLLNKFTLLDDEFFELGQRETDPIEGDLVIVFVID